MMYPRNSRVAFGTLLRKYYNALQILKAFLWKPVRKYFLLYLLVQIALCFDADTHLRGHSELSMFILKQAVNQCI